MDKPFKSIEDQVALLESRGVETDGGTGEILLREGYYAVVNGYKQPFLDQSKTIQAGDDRYKKGTKFSDIHSLFLFDRALREETFHCLIRVEAMVRTVCAYTFSEKHPNKGDYLRQDCFATQAEYEDFGLKHYISNIQELHATLMRKSTKSKRDFIRHYREKHEWIPLWVLCKELTFGNVEHFFNLMKPEEQRLVCKRIANIAGKTKEDGYFSPREARLGLEILVKARNICAHDERLYCANLGGRRNVNFIEMLAYLKRYLTTAELDDYLKRIAATTRICTDESVMASHVLRRMGFEAAEDDDGPTSASAWQGDQSN